LIPAYLFQDTLLIRVAQVLIFAGLASLAGKRIKWFYFVIMVSSITFFNLLTPMGRILVQLGPWPITETALERGLMKGFTIVGLVFISLFSIRPDLKLPGRLGGLVGRVFYYFEQIMEGRGRIEAKRLIPSIDEVLTGLFRPDGEGEPEKPMFTPVQTTFRGAAFVVVLLLVNWGLLVL
jgi:heptaprenyl diphosphate synthase